MAWNQIISYTLASSSVVVCDWLSHSSLLIRAYKNFSHWKSHLLVHLFLKLLRFTNASKQKLLIIGVNAYKTFSSIALTVLPEGVTIFTKFYRL